MPNWKRSDHCPYCGEQADTFQTDRDERGWPLDDGTPIDVTCKKCGQHYKHMTVTVVKMYTAKMRQPAKQAISKAEDKK